MLEDDDIWAVKLYDAITTLAAYVGILTEERGYPYVRQIQWEMEVAAEAVSLEQSIGLELEETDPVRADLQIKLLTYILGDANLERIDDADEEILNRNIIQVAEYEIISRMRGVVRYIDALDEGLFTNRATPRRVIDLVINRLNFELHETTDRIKEEDDVEHIEEMEHEQEILQWFMVYLQEAAQLADRYRERSN